jgi:hypothetical protein
MPEIVERRRNRAPWIAFLLTLIAIGLTALIFMGQSATLLLVWLGLLAGLGAVAFALAGIRRAFGGPQAGGKVSSSVFGILAFLVCGLLVFGWFHARALPASAGAPRVGQKAPDFTLADTQGNKVSLSQLLSGDSAAASNTGAAPTRAVLLIFYRGYW